MLRVRWRCVFLLCIFPLCLFSFLPLFPFVLSAGSVLCRSLPFCLLYLLLVLRTLLLSSLCFPYYWCSYLICSNLPPLRTTLIIGHYNFIHVHSSVFQSSSSSSLRQNNSFSGFFLTSFFFLLLVVITPTHPNFLLHSSYYSLHHSRSFHARDNFLPNFARSTFPHNVLQSSTLTHVNSC